MKSSASALRWILIIILLLLMLDGVSNESVETQESDSVSSPFIISNGYTPHEPFNITSDTILESLGLDGSGTESDPYLIDGYNFSDYTEESAIILEDTTKHVLINGCYFGGQGKVSVQVFRAENVTISNNTFVADWRSVYTTQALNLRILNNSFTYPVALYYTPGSYIFANNSLEHPQLTYSGHYFHTVTNATIANNTCASGGISIDTGSNLTFYENYINGLPIGYFENLENTSINANGYGQVIVNLCKNVTVNGGTPDRAGHGIQVLSSDNCTVNGTIATNCWSGIGLARSNNTVVSKVKTYTTGGPLIYGVGLAECINVTVKNCTLGDCGYYGVSCWGYNTEVKVFNNTLHDCGSGMRITTSYNVSVWNNDIHSNSYGFYIDNINEGIENVSIFLNDIHDNIEGGFQLNEIKGRTVIIHNNTFTGEKIGIEVINCTSCPVIEDNFFLESQEFGVTLTISKLAKVNNNTMTGGGLCLNNYIDVHALNYIPEDEWRHNVSSNTINGQPLVHLMDLSDQVIEEPAGQVWVVNCTNIAMPNLNLSDAGIGVGVAFSNNVTISNLTALHNSRYGIFCIDTPNCTIEYCKLRDNWEGMYLLNCWDSLVFNNTCKYNAEQGAIFSCTGINITNNEFGINTGVGVLGSYGNVQIYGGQNGTVFNNTFYESWCGLYLQVLSDFHVQNNTVHDTWNAWWLDRVERTHILENRGYKNCKGIAVWYSHNNTIYDNVFDVTVGYGGQKAPYSIHLRLSNNNTLTNNTILHNDISYVYFETSNGTYFNSSLIEGGPLAIRIENSTHTTIKFINMTPTDDGIESFRCQDISILGNRINITNHGTVFNISESSRVHLSGNIQFAKSLEYGLYAGWSDNITCNYMNFENATAFGIRFFYSDDSSAINDTLSNCSIGIHVECSDGSDVINCTVDNCPLGISIWASQYCTVQNNNLSISGFRLDNEFLIVSNNWVNRKPVGYFANLTSGSLNMSDYGQIVLANCEDVNVYSGNFVNVSIGVSLFGCDNCTVYDVIVESAFEYSILFENCDNCTLERFKSTFQGGVSIQGCSDCNIQHGITNSSSGWGVYVRESPYTSVYNVTSIKDGIDIYRSNHSTVVFCKSSDSPGWGLLIYWSDDCLVENCTFYDRAGLGISYSSDITIMNCTILDCWSPAGILIEFTVNCTLIQSKVRENPYDGVYLVSSSDCKFINNRILNNTLYGLNMDGLCSDNEVYGNIIAYNGFGNALDDGVSNDWDNGIDTGNSWDDYSGVGTYSISGSANSLDRYPQLYDVIQPSIDSPDDFEYDEGTTGHTIQWSPRDDHPSSYAIIENGTQISSGPWGGGDIQRSVSGLTVGVYNYTLVVTDLAGNNASDTVFVVVVIDSTSPTIDSPDDIIIEESSTGNNITWTPSDAYPYNFQLLLDGNLEDSDDWNGSQIIIWVGPLVMGTYNYTIIVYDEYGHDVTDTVFVEVIDTTAPDIESPGDLWYFVGETGNVIRWNISDAHIAGAMVLKDGLQDASAEFLTTYVTISIDGLAIGSYNYTVIVWDTSANENVNTVIVTVEESGIPVIDHPDDFEYVEGTTGHSIVWNPATVNPSNYEVFLNGSEFESGSWDGSEVQVDIDGLIPGVHNITIVVYDETGYSVTDSVFVTVIFNPPPTLDSPQDLRYSESLPLGLITWNPVDDNPLNYSVLLNSSLLESGPWSGDAITVNVSGLVRAIYNVTIIVQDIGRKTAVDTVYLQVVYEFNPPQVDSPPDLMYTYGDTGNLITWSTYDEHPWRYLIELNGTNIELDDWITNLITISVDDLLPGAYNYTVILYDEDSNWAFDSVIVNVESIPPPNVNSPNDLTFTDGSVGNNITWTPSSDAPSHYEIFVNGTLVASGNWDGGPIEFNTDNLGPGMHNVTLITYDEVGSSISDSVIVTVNPQSGILGIDPLITNVLSLVAIVLVLLIGYRLVKSATEEKKEEDWKDILEDFSPEEF